ncbi:MAG: hypothetical protein GVY13_19340 [Alphaproteobacteria bacterium]|jgi:hypothetical protein|nr:hypothetical protein [Alphaproteobacteria bacterium]
MPSENDAELSPYRRLGVKVETAFTMACNQRDVPVAELLYECLELLTIHHADAGEAEHQAQLDALADAQAELSAVKASQ